MKQELERIKTDVDTIQRVLGLAPSIRQEWIQWMKRDNWLNLGWFVPGLILIASAWLPPGGSERFLGLLPPQWVGLAVAGVLLGITATYMRKMTGQDGRPDSLVREYKRINGLDAKGFWLNLTLLLGLVFFFIWGKQNHLPFGAFWSGLFVFMGCSCLLLAAACRVWLLLGWAIPFIAYGLLTTLLPGAGKVSGAALGMMFIAVGVCFFVIQVLQIRRIEGAYGSH